MSFKKGQNTPALLLFLGRGAALMNGDGNMTDDFQSGERSRSPRSADTSGNAGGEVCLELDDC